MTSPLPPRPEKPARPWFSSGPTAKPPGWRAAAIDTTLEGRSIRAPEVLERFRAAAGRTLELLQAPADRTLLFMPGSDTGAMEAALWNLLGERPVQVLSYENFGRLWAEDVRDHLGLAPEVLEAAYGDLPDLSRVRPDHDLVFAWNGTTSGVRVPDGAFIAPDRTGLTICDATSAAFSMPLDWARLDVVTFSFQKALGGEAGIGALVLSPRAIARLERFTPDRPVPKILRLKDKAGFERRLGRGDPLNTYSVLTLEDWILALDWADSVGGLEALVRRTRLNFETLSAWVERTGWIDFLAWNPSTRSETSVCLKFSDTAAEGRDETQLRALSQALCERLQAQGAAFDLEPHRSAPPGLRIWCGATVDTADIALLTQWLDWGWRGLDADLR